ncbi:MAG TPA: histidinol dehydrogenase, partial [Gemmatimonadaceae bacterium]|nr:histidinol dehydrogenase [Gemmatimonadaceae bacterium]
MSTATQLAMRFSGRLSALSREQRDALFDRSTSSDDTVRERTAEIVRDVRARGDAALREYARRFDNVELDSLEVPRSKWTEALDQLEPALRRAMERSARNITRAHEAFMPSPAECETEPGVIVGRRPDPL